MAGWAVVYRATQLSLDRPVAMRYVEGTDLRALIVRPRRGEGLAWAASESDGLLLAIRPR